MDSFAVVRVSVAFWTWLLRRSAPVIPDVFIVREICDVLKLEFQKYAISTSSSRVQASNLLVFQRATCSNHAFLKFSIFLFHANS